MSGESTVSSAAVAKDSYPQLSKPRKYEQVASKLRERIHTGFYTRKLPGVRVLSAELDSNPVTVGRAIKLLAAEDLLFSVPKSGTYIQKDGARRTGVVAFVANDMALPMTSKILAGLTAAAQERKQKLILFNYARCPNREAAIIREIARERSADGILWIPSSIEAGACGRSLFGQMPFVGIGPGFSGVDGFFVSSDPFDGFRKLARHLVERGCGRIAYVTDQPQRRVLETDPRFLGFRSIMEAAGLVCGRPLVVPSVNEGDWSTETKREVVRRIIRFDGLLCTHDRLAARIHQLLVFGKIRCPANIALASYDGLEISEALGITTYVQSFEEIGWTALALLLRLIASPGGEAGNEMISGRLVIRQSTEIVTHEKDE